MQGGVTHVVIVAYFKEMFFTPVSLVFLAVSISVSLQSALSSCLYTHEPHSLLLPWTHMLEPHLSYWVQKHSQSTCMCLKWLVTATFGSSEPFRLEKWACRDGTIPTQSLLTLIFGTKWDIPTKYTYSQLSAHCTSTWSILESVSPQSHAIPGKHSSVCPPLFH